ncbi:MAG: mannonate dehydratase [Bacteroidota bacterium]
MALEKTWRWYGPNDPISLEEIRQTGATGIVNALHHIPNGDVWEIEEILKRKNIIEAAGLSWSVVESVPVHEDIKKQEGNYLQYLSNYKQTLINLGDCGIDTVCYNFMPVLDWSRTNLNWEFGDGTKALRFEAKVFAAFDMFILERPGAEADYPPELLAEAKTYFNTLNDNGRKRLIETILLGLPGSEETYTLDAFKSILESYKQIGDQELRKSLYDFLREIIPVAEKAGIFMAIHPDDPPWPLLGLPRVVSTLEDTTGLIKAVDSPANGITLCTGSFGAGHFNDLVEMTKMLAHRINFIHLRNVCRDSKKNFHEDKHLEGNIDMYEVMKTLILEQRHRKKTGRTDTRMPMRPDHGHLMLDDIKKAKTYPGYSLIGRMKGLAELSGLELGIEKSLNDK